MAFTETVITTASWKNATRTVRLDCLAGLVLAWLYIIGPLYCTADVYLVVKDIKTGNPFYNLFCCEGPLVLLFLGNFTDDKEALMLSMDEMTTIQAK